VSSHDYFHVHKLHLAMHKRKINERNGTTEAHVCQGHSLTVSRPTEGTLSQQSFFEGYKPSPIRPFVTTSELWRWVRNTGDMVLTRYNRNTGRRIWPSAISSTINLTRTVTRPNSGVRGESPATYRLIRHPERYCKTDSVPRSNHGASRLENQSRNVV
jgi:hypothetical protein